jgi:hypothetical protein
MSVAGLRDGALVDPAEVTTTSWSRLVQLSAEVPVAIPLRDSRARDRSRVSHPHITPRRSCTSHVPESVIGAVSS